MSQVTAPASPPSQPSVETPATDQTAPGSAAQTTSPTQDTQSQPRLPSNPQRLAVARREAAAKAKEQELKALEAKLLEREKALAPPPPKALRDRLVQDFEGTLKAEGFERPEELTDVMVQAASSPEARRILQLESQLKAIDERFQQLNQSLQKRDEDQYQQNLQIVSREVRSLIARSDDYPFIRETGSEDDVVEHIRAEFEATGNLMAYAEAAKAIEDSLTENYRKVFASDKVQARLSQTPVGQPPADPAKATIDPKSLLKGMDQGFKVKPVADQQPKSSVPSTLTNAHTVSYSQGSSEEDRIQRAILKVQGKLPQ